MRNASSNTCRPDGVGDLAPIIILERRREAAPVTLVQLVWLAIIAVSLVPVALVGFMGAGKTTVGEQVARLVGRPFRDLDLEVQEGLGMSIASFFEAEGEPAFRVREAAATVRALRDPQPSVIALGGGAVATRAIREALRPHVSLPIDVHLMVKPVDRIVPDFARAGASLISFHPEASEHVDRTIGLIHEHGCKAGLVFNPATPLDYLEYVIDKVDMVLLMSVNPGFGGQSFIPTTLKKLKKARSIIDASGRDIRLEIDGGVKVDNIREIAEAGADTFVAGSAVFGAANSTDANHYDTVIKAFRAELAKVGK